MAEHPIQGFMDSTLKNLKTMIDVNTIVGDAITSPDGTIIIPVSTVGFGFGAGGSEFGERSELADNRAANDGKCFGGGCGGGVSIKPTAFLVVNNNGVRLLPMDGSSSPIEKIIDLVPELINKVNDVFSNKDDDDGENISQDDDVKTVNVIDLDD